MEHIQATGEKELNFSEDSEISLLDVGDCNITINITNGANVKIKHFSKDGGKKHMIFNLNEEKSSVDVMDLFLIDGNKTFFDVEFNHNFPNTESSIQSRCIIRNKSSIDYNGIIRIKENCSGCVGSQNQKAILLSDDSEAKFTPILEIDNNDVKVSHSSSIGKISEESLFYLMSRGLSSEEAKISILEGFLKPIKNSFPEWVEVKI